MNKYKLKNFISKRKCTLLGVGPMSLNCVDASIELANEFDIPLFLIASRRQVDSESLGGGYVNNWTTKEFSDYAVYLGNRIVTISSAVMLILFSIL